MKTKRRQHIGTMLIGGSQLELYLCNRVLHRGRRVPACQRDEVVEFDRHLPLEDLARLGAALACREFRELDGQRLSEGPLHPAAHVTIEGTPFAVRTVERSHTGDGVLCYRADVDSRELLVARHTRRRAIVWGIGAAETVWDYLAWRRGDGKPYQIPRVVTLKGADYQVKVACGRLFVRGDDGQAEEARLFLDFVDRTVTLPGGTDPADWPDVVADLEDSAARWSPFEGRAAA